MLERKNTKLIAFMGIDGAGKTSVVNGFSNYLSERGISCAIFNNALFGSNPITRSLDISRNQFNTTQEYIPAELDMYMQAIQFLANARTHLTKMEGSVEIVLADRYDLCRIVYARVAGGVGGQTAEKMVMFASDLRKPDGIVYLDVSLETALKRIYDRNQFPSWKERPENMQQAKDTFDLLLQNTSNVTRINADRDLDQILEEVVNSYRSGILFTS